MKNLTKLLITLSSALTLALMSSFNVDAEDKPNKKRGQVYFKMVCTVCHMKIAGLSIPPADYTMEQWAVYFDADNHDKTGKTGKTNNKVSYYVSTEYRESIRDTNKAAKRFMKLSNEQLYADVRKFSVNGAKDSDTPATCN